MRTLTIEETKQVSGAGGDDVKVLSDILSNFANHSVNDNSILNGNDILNFTCNTVLVDLL